MSRERRYTLLDRVLMHADEVLRRHTSNLGATSAGSGQPSDESAPTYPGAQVREQPLTHPERRHAAGLMRVNHAGEVAAQALYDGQGLFARAEPVRRSLRESALEEGDHLAWCRARLDELDAAPSRLDPVWYAGSFAIGALVGARGDAESLGFVAETERQVVRHLEGHLGDLPQADRRSRAVLRQMIEDETRHGTRALSQGGRLPGIVIRTLMRITAKVMTKTAYHV